MKPRTRAGFWRFVTSSLAVVFAVAWAAQVLWQAEFRPCSKFMAGFGGGTMKLCVGGWDGAGSLFPASTPVQAPMIDRWVSQRSGAWTWGFHAHVAESPYTATIPMWFPVGV